MFYSVTHMFWCNHFFTVWPVLHSDLCFQMWLNLHSATNFFYSVTHFWQCDPVYTVSRIFPNESNFRNVTHIFKCGPFLTVWPIFSLVAPFSIFVYSVTHFSIHASQCDSSYTEWLVFFQTCLIFLQCDLHF